MEPIELPSRASAAWQRRAVTGLAVVIAAAGTALAITRGDEPRRTAVANENTPTVSTPRALPNDDDHSNTPLDIGSDTTTTAIRVSVTSTTDRLSEHESSTTSRDLEDYPHTTQPPVAPDPLIKDWSAGVKGGNPYKAATGPNGSVWFTMRNGASVGRIDRDGNVTVFRLPDSTAAPKAIVRGPDDAMWFTYEGHSLVGRLTMAGDLTEFYVPFSHGADTIAWAGDAFLLTNMYGPIVRLELSGESSSLTEESPFPDSMGELFVDRSGQIWMDGARLLRFELVAYLSTFGAKITGGPGAIAHKITQAPDGALWFASWKETTPYAGEEQLVRYFDGAMTSFGGLGSERITGLTFGSDGNIWFAQEGANRIGRMTGTGKLRFFDVASPVDVISGADGNIWFTEGWNVSMAGGDGNKIGRIDLSQL